MIIMLDCLFCKIVAGIVPSAKVYEDEGHLAFLDIYPANKGHTLVIPKKHYAHFSQIHSKEIGEYIKVVQKVAQAVKKSMKSDGINVFLNEGEAAGQVILHAHFHVIPRFNGDGIVFKVGRNEYTLAEKEEYRKKIQIALRP
jgi:histidine triad (HIT) family protein